MMLKYLVFVGAVVVTQSNGFWWLNKEGAFGGMNYDDQEIAQGLHIKKEDRVEEGSKNISREVREGLDIKENAVKLVRKRRQSRTRSRNRNRVQDIIPFKEIVTECPTGSICIDQAFCLVNRKQDVRRNLIPCLLTEDERKFGEEGKFGVCCSESFPRICPRVVRVPSREDCALAVDECRIPREQDTCNRGSLCCWNGCSNMCIDDPPFEPLDPFFKRGFFRVVGRRPKDETADEPFPRPTTTRRPPSTAGPTRPTTRPPFTGEPTTRRTTTNKPIKLDEEDDYGDFYGDGFDYEYDFEIFARKGNRRGNL